MKNVILLCMICFTGLQLRAQKTFSDNDLIVKFGSPYEIPKDYIDLGYVGDIESGFVQVSFKPKKDLLLQVFDKELKVKKSNNLDITTFPRDFRNEGFYHVGQNDFWFFSTFERKDERETFWVQQIDIPTGKMVNSPRELMLNNRLEGSTYSRYTICQSFDKSKILISYILQHKERNEKINREEIGFCVLDENMKVVTNKIITMPFPEEILYIKDRYVDNKGNAYLLAKIYNDRRKGEKKDDKPNYYFELFRLKAGMTELTEVKLKLESYFITDLFVAELESGNMMVGGFYSRTAGSGSDGIYLSKVDEEGNVSLYGKGYYEFPLEVLKQFLTERQQRKMEKKDKQDDVEAKNLVLRKIIFNANGNLEIVSEVAYVVTTTHSDGKTTWTTTTYYYEDILVMKITTGGDIAWVKKIPKKQVGSNGRGSMGIACFPIGDQTYIFYTDNVKNLNLAPNKVPEDHRDGKGGFLVYSKVDKDGNVSKGQLFDYREEEIRFEPADFQELGDNVFANRAFKDRMSRVVLLQQKTKQ